MLLASGVNSVGQWCCKYRARSAHSCTHMFECTVNSSSPSPSSLLSFLYTASLSAVIHAQHQFEPGKLYQFREARFWEWCETSHHVARSARPDLVQGCGPQIRSHFRARKLTPNRREPTVGSCRFGAGMWFIKWCRNGLRNPDRFLILKAGTYSRPALG